MEKVKKLSKLVTVFTPTYNRAKTLQRLYDSLCRQTNKNFEWIVVDDGSTDNTEVCVKSYLNHNNNFYIRYVKTENKGKHCAINLGVSLAEGEYFFIVDSDDYLSENAIERIYYWFSTIDCEASYAGICGNRFHPECGLIGTTFDGSFVDAPMHERSRYNINGDKAEVFYTNILKQYPFPCFVGETFLSEGVVWNRISADGYLMRHFNENIYCCQYLPEGLSNNLLKLRKKNIKGTLLFFKELYFLQKCLWDKFKTGSFYVRFAKYNKFSFREIKEELHENSFMVMALYLFYVGRLFLEWKRKGKM